VFHQIPAFSYESGQRHFLGFPPTAPLLPSLLQICYRRLRYLNKIGDARRAQVRRKVHKSVSETFPTKAQAQAWGGKVEAEMDARRFNDVRGLANITLKALIDLYCAEIGGVHRFVQPRLFDMPEQTAVFLCTSGLRLIGLQASIFAFFQSGRA
jgi:hypothetical protein